MSQETEEFSIKRVYDSLIQPVTALLVAGIFVLTLYYNGVYVPKSTYERDKERAEAREAERTSAFQRLIAEMKEQQIKQSEAALAETRLNRQAIDGVNITIATMRTQQEQQHDHEIRLREIEKSIAAIRAIKP